MSIKNQPATPPTTHLSIRNVPIKRSIPPIQIIIKTLKHNSTEENVNRQLNIIINCAYFNARSHRLRNLLRNGNLDVILITEAWLNNKTSNSLL